MNEAPRILREAFPEGHQSRLTFLDPLAETYSRRGRDLEAASISADLEESQIARFFGSSKFDDFLRSKFI